MLRTEFPFTLEHWWQRLVAVLLGEAFLGFLALIAVALTLFPWLFPVSPAQLASLDAAQWVIIGWFGVEYIAGFAFAPSKSAFLRNPWRWLDLLTIIIPLASVIPGVSRAFRSSPILRLFRLIRVVTFGVRASGIVVRHHVARAGEKLIPGPVQVTRVQPEPELAAQPSDWNQLIQWLREKKEGWFHVANPSADELKQITAAAELPATFLESNFFTASHPHVATGKDYVGLFVWLPERDAGGRIERRATLLLAWKDRLLSLSRRPAHVVERLAPPLAEAGMENLPLSVRALHALALRVVRENESLVAGYEQELRAIEDVPIRKSEPAFFEQTFRLKKELAAAQTDLWHFKAAVAKLSHRGIAPLGTGDEVQDAFSQLSAGADYLYDTVVNIREETISVIELHINVVSFDMNRVMRILAVVSVLGLFPAVIGGLFGMNLIDNPWHFTLPQVAFAICFLMVSCLYFFYVKGWLR